MKTATGVRVVFFATPWSWRRRNDTSEMTVPSKRVEVVAAVTAAQASKVGACLCNHGIEHSTKLPQYRRYAWREKNKQNSRVPLVGDVNRGAGVHPGVLRTPCPPLPRPSLPEQQRAWSQKRILLTRPTSSSSRSGRSPDPAPGDPLDVGVAPAVLGLTLALVFLPLSGYVDASPSSPIPASSPRRPSCLWRVLSPEPFRER